VTADLYDEIPYPSVPFQQTHPDRLAVLASLYGLRPAPVERCRILELGCGDGGNLIPMALGLPSAKLVGIDLAGQPIARGQETIEKLGLGNVTLHQEDLCTFARQPEPEPFDYIIAHGVYSWVPPDAREALLAICRRNLAPQGVAYVSYNAYPGSHTRDMVREMLLYHVAGAPDSQATIDRARGLARLLADALVASDDLTGLRSDLRAAATRHAGALFHDELSPVNQPFYLHEVAERAGAHGLQFLAEADFVEMQDRAFSPAVREILAAVEQERGRVAREQYLDFLKARRFRQTVFCRADLTLTGSPSASDLCHFLIGSPVRPTSAEPDLRPGAVAKVSGGESDQDPDRPAPRQVRPVGARRRLAGAAAVRRPRGPGADAPRRPRPAHITR
jgi:SAM-dependent methyltransferase